MSKWYCWFGRDGKFYAEENYKDHWGAFYIDAVEASTQQDAERLCMEIVKNRMKKGIKKIIEETQVKDKFSSMMEG